MTMPCERTRAVLCARDFLLRLSSPYAPNGLKGIPGAVRQEARKILRHFPIAFDLVQRDAFDEQVIEDWFRTKDAPTPAEAVLDGGSDALGG